MLSPPAPDERGPFLDYDFSESYSYHINYTAEVARCASGYARPKPDIHWRAIDALGNEISKIYPTRGHFSFNPEMIDYEDDYFYTGAEFSLNIEEGFQVNSFKIDSKLNHMGYRFDVGGGCWRRVDVSDNFEMLVTYSFH